MSDIFREVDEALNREAALFWKNYGPTLVGCALIMILATAITTGYMHWQTAKNRAETAKIITAFGEEANMMAALENAAANTQGAHKAIALLSAGNKAAMDKNFAKAQEAYDGVVDDSGAPADLRDFARILSVRTAQVQAGSATPDYKALIEKLNPVVKNAGSAFNRQARLEAAALYGDGLKDYTAALDLLKGLDKEAGADSLTEKASALKHVYGHEASHVTPAGE